MRLWVEDLRRHLATVHEARLRQRCLELLVIKGIAAQGVRHVHIDYAPRRQHRLLVRVAERGEYLRDTLDTLLYGQSVGVARHLAYALGCGGKDVRVIVLAEGVELLLGHATRHKLLP